MKAVSELACLQLLLLISVNTTGVVQALLTVMMRCWFYFLINKIPDGLHRDKKALAFQQGCSRMSA